MQPASRWRLIKTWRLGPMDRNEADCGHLDLGNAADFVRVSADNVGGK